ncbi:hypothetical protein JHK82_048301 [Glycine max]|nr:hypothetical protein JHK82_048301 [Glycine max]
MATTLSEAYRDHPLHLHHIIPLDFSSLRTLPDSHAWPQSEDGDGDDDNHGIGSPIPIIDLMDPNAMELIGLACENWGAFQLKNHGIPLSVVEEVEEEAKRLFALPADRKLKALRSVTVPCHGYGRARISPFFPKQCGMKDLPSWGLHVMMPKRFGLMTMHPLPLQYVVS